MGTTTGPLPPTYIRDGLIFNIDCLNTDSYPGSGTVWTSTVNATNIGTMDAGVTFDGTHMVFVSDKVSFDQSSSPITNDPMSTEMWFYSDGGGHDAVIATRHQTSTDDGIYMKHHANRIYVYTNELNPPFGNRSTYSSTNFAPNTWWHLVVTTEGSTYPGGIKIYRNGVNDIAGSDPISQPWTSQTILPLHIGSEVPEGNTFEGNIDIVRTYDRVLTQAEVLNNFNVEKDRFGL